jgi:hypothetical protein
VACANSLQELDSTLFCEFKRRRSCDLGLPNQQMAPRSVTRASRSRNPATADAEAQAAGQNHSQGEQEVS